MRLDGTTQCLAVGGHWLAIVDTQSSGAAPVPPVTLELAAAMGEEAGIVMLESPPRPGRFRVRLHAPADRGGAVIAESEPFDVSPLETGCQGFEGVWETDFGVLRLAERGPDLSGTFRKSAQGQAGVVTGRRDGEVVRGRWRSEFGAGGFRLALVPGERRFTGTWSRFLDHTAGDGTWNGSCLDGDGQPVR